MRHGFGMTCFVAVVLMVGLSQPVIAADGHNHGNHHGDALRVFMVLHRSGAAAEQGFREALHDTGLEIHYTIRNIEQDATRLPAIVAEIKAQRPDLIYTQSTIVTQGIAGLVSQADDPAFIHDLPIVFSMVANPVDSGLVTNLEHPGRNLTGAVHVAALPVQLRALQAYLPVGRIGMVYNAGEKTQTDMLRNFTALAADAGITVIAEAPMNAAGKADPAQIVPMVERLAAQKPDIIYVPQSNFFFPYSDVMMAALRDRNLASFCAIEVQIQAGGMIGLVAPMYNVGSLAGYKAEQILFHGQHAADIPIETLSRFSFVLNMDTIRRVKSYPPIQVLRYAHVINP